MPRTAEPGFNHELANILRRKHPRWPDRIGVEQTNVFSEAAGLKPDIIVSHPGGLPVAVETEYTPAHTVEQDARERLGKILQETGDSIEQALAVRVPKALAKINQNALEAAIEKARLEFCLFSGDPEHLERWPKTGWLDGSVDDLAACIELAALSENRIAQGMQILEDGIDQAAGKLRDACADAPDTLESIANELHQKDGEQTSRMAMAILANALTFHTTIAGVHGIDTLDQLRGANGKLSKTRVLNVWKYILTKINYWPIFKIASDILLPIRNGTAQEILDRLSIVAAELQSLGATSQHDLCGRMFQRLITDRKFLATFYTLPSSATLLAELAVARLDIDWSNRDDLAALRIGDFACGTGALLNAAYEAILSRYRRTGGDDRAIHPEMIERVLVGTDIMPAATHLTASVLSNTHPTVPFANTFIVTLPYGTPPKTSYREIAIGALDLIDGEQTLPLFGTGQKQVRGTDDSDDNYVNIPHKEFDLVIMNPPFTRPTNHEIADVPVPSFAGFATSDDEMKHMSDRLKKIRTNRVRMLGMQSMVGHGNAGLASYFVDLAHAKVKRSGVLAMVLPASFLQGEAWSAARRLLEESYKDVVVVSIAASGTTDSAFSADTGMAEVLVIGTRRSRNEQTNGTTLYVNLLHRPQTILEAVTVARTVQRVPADSPTGSIAIGSGERVGCSIRSTLADTGCAGLREAGVVKAATGLVRGELQLPRRNSPIPLPITKLGKLGDRGLLDRDINGTEIIRANLPRGPFDIVSMEPDRVSTWPSLWSHNAARETQMIVKPDSAGEIRSGCDERAEEVWEKTASRLHFNRDFRINSQPLAACLTPELSIGGRAWPNFLCTDRRWETPLVLWANTILGLISFWWIGARQQQGRAVLTITKLPVLTVLDPQALTVTQLDHADRIFEEFKNQDMLPANEAWRDKTRQALDRAVLIDLLGLSEDVLEPLALLRRQWCAEPSVHGGKSTALV